MSAQPRTRTYDRAILQWIAYHRAATVHQVLSRFFVARRKSASYGERVVLRLVREGYLLSTPLTPERGRASRRVLRLTRHGWRRLNVAPPAGWNRPIAGNVLEYRLQFAEVMMVRATQNWRLAAPQEAAALVRDWMLREYRHRMLNDSEIVVRDRLERQSLEGLDVHVLVHRASGDVRFIVAVRRSLSVAKRLAAIPATALWPRVEIEMVCSDVLKLDAANTAIDRWAARHGVLVKIHRVAHHRTRAHPRALHANP